MKRCLREHAVCNGELLFGALLVFAVKPTFRPTMRRPWATQCWCSLLGSH